MLETGNISTIVFHLGNDISKTGEIFIINDPYMFLQNKRVEGFVQVLKSGGHRLLKYMQRKVGSAAPFLDTKKIFFYR